MVKKLINWIIAHKKLSALIFIVLLIIGLAGSSGNKNANTSTNVASSQSTSVPKTSGKATFEAVLWNPANDNNTSNTLPAAGWDANDGWDTASQADIDSQNSNAIQPAVIVKDAKTLEVYINVKNTGSAPGTAICKVDASSAIGDPTTGQYFGVNNKTFTALNGGDIKPGDYGERIDDLTITNQGARFIKQITIHC